MCVCGAEDPSTTHLFVAMSLVLSALSEHIAEKLVRLVLCCFGQNCFEIQPWNDGYFDNLTAAAALLKDRRVLALVAAEPGSVDLILISMFSVKFLPCHEGSRLVPHVWFNGASDECVILRISSLVCDGTSCNDVCVRGGRP